MTAYKTLIGLCDKITHLNGVVNPEGINNLDDELGSVCVGPQIGMNPIALWGLPDLEY